MAYARVCGPGVPDQTCDFVAAGIVEEYLRRDPNAQLNLRVCGGRGALFVAGDVSSSADFDVSAVVRRALGQCGVNTPMEPFIALETMTPAWAKSSSSREPIHVMGYATSETPDYFPKAVSLARTVAQELEHRRTGDPDWFWLGSDYEVCVSDDPKPLMVIRAEHVESKSLASVREEITDLIVKRIPNADIRVNPAGEEMRSGLGSRMGGSKSASAVDQYGSALPSMMSGAGLHVSHPLNLGAWLARSFARELVSAGRGKAIMIHIFWLPLESKPFAVKIRNEKGEDLSSLISMDRFDMVHAPESFLIPSLATSSLRASFDSTILLPWES